MSKVMVENVSFHPGEVGLEFSENCGGIFSLAPFTNRACSWQTRVCKSLVFAHSFQMFGLYQKPSL